MEQTDPLISIALLLALALAGGMIAHRLRQPIILGYLIIGMITGPNLLGLVKDPMFVESAASMGLALLMFTLGMEISVSQLREAGKIGVYGGLAQILITIAVGMLAGLFIFQWTIVQSVLFGMIISLSSTAVCLKILMERGELGTLHGNIMVAILVLQDIAVVAMMVILPLFDGSSGNTLSILLLAAGKSILVIGIALILGQWVLPWLLGTVGQVRARELFILTILVLCLGAMIETRYFGLSMVFGAFLIGMVLRSTRFVHQALADITPLRDIFATLFFVSIGMILNPLFIMEHWQEILIMVAVISAIKFIIIFGILRLFKYSNRIALMTGVGLMHVGEFGFIITQNGTSTGIFNEHQGAVIISGAVVTMFLTPLFISLASRLNQRQLAPKEIMVVEDTVFASIPESTEPGNIIIAGYGRVGENLSQGLLTAGLCHTIIDIDSERIAKAHNRKIDYIYGDSSNYHVLQQADLRTAKALVITYPGQMAIAATIKNARSINPRIRILARCHREKEFDLLTRMGANELVNPEFETSFKLLKKLLKISGVKKESRKIIVDSVRQQDDTQKH